MGMQLLLHMSHQRKHRQVRGCLKIALVHIKCVCAESISQMAQLMHMATCATDAIFMLLPKRVI